MLRLPRVPILALPALLFMSGVALAEDIDSDGDLVCDLDEDTDSDGNLDDNDRDDDGIPDYLDEDDDGDGVLTRDEDADGDGDPLNDDLDGFGVPDYLDPNTPKDIDRDRHISETYGGDDCDDTRFGIKPSADHDPLYDGEDWDCDGGDDFDGDGDGYQSAREIEGGEDCDDYDPETHPGASEDLGPEDRDCDGWTDPVGHLVSRGGCDCAYSQRPGASAALLLLGMLWRRR